MYTLTSTLLLKSPTHSIQESLSNNLILYLYIYISSMSFTTSFANISLSRFPQPLLRSAILLPPCRFPFPRASWRKDTCRQDQHKIASQSWPWKLRKTTSCRASLCTLGGKPPERWVKGHCGNWHEKVGIFTTDSNPEATQKKMAWDISGWHCQGGDCSPWN